MTGIARTTGRVMIMLIALLVLVSGTIAAGQTQTYLGDVVTLSGYSSGGDAVYLFLTGPNLPQDGVALDNINRPADQGGATRVDVDADGHWTYQWYTGSSGGGLDAGAYTVWVADRPVDRSHLSVAEYSTIGVSLLVPSLNAGITGGSAGLPQPGSIAFTAIPDGTSVVVNTEYRGRTPLNVGNLSPGVYNVTFSHFGYAKLSQQVTVESGSVTEVNATLVLLTGSLVVNTTPSGAQLTLDNVSAGISPGTLPAIPQGTHLLSITKEGYVTQNITVLIPADQTTTTDVVLVPSVRGMTWLSGFLPSTAAAGILVTLLAVRRRSKERETNGRHER